MVKIETTACFKSYKKVHTVYGLNILNLNKRLKFLTFLISHSFVEYEAITKAIYKQMITKCNIINLKKKYFKWKYSLFKDCI